jgi:lysophospholipase L1-like esterase
VKKLVLFGDSLFAEIGKDRTALLERTLSGYDVYNCAVAGWDTNDCVAKAPYISKLQSDVVVISLGTNDASPWKQVPLEKFQQNIPKIFEAFHDSKVIYLLPPPVDEAKTTKAFNSPMPDMKSYNEAAKTLCQEHGIAYIDSFAVFKPLLDAGREYHTEDGMHLNDFAYEIIAAELARILA